MPTNVKKKTKTDDSHLPVIECNCGVKILLVPNVKQMSQAIEAHAVEHAKKFKTQKEKDAETAKVSDELIAKVLDKACEA